MPGLDLRHTEPVMGTLFSLHVRAADWTTEQEWWRTRDRVVGFLHRVDRVFSTYRPFSQIRRLDRGELSLDGCSPCVREVLALGAALHRRSDGYFTVRPAGRLDPSGLVKGWAIERAGALLTAAGATAHAVNGGGDVQVVGGLGDGRPWRVALADPLLPGALLGVVARADGAVATSGTAERGAHIWDPRAGRPAAGLAAVTVVGPSITLADAYATAAFARGPGAAGWLSGLEGYDALVVDAHGERWQTPGFTWDPAPTPRTPAPPSAAATIS